MNASGHGEAPAPFIVGVARSGTTLLRLMLDAHPWMAIPPETHFLHQALELEAASEGELREAFAAAVTGSFTWGDFGLDRHDFRRALAAVEPFTLGGGVRCFYRAYAARHGKERWGDKTPTYTTLVPALCRHLPEARILHLLRDGRAVAASRRPMSFGPGPSVRAQARDWAEKVRAARAAGAGSSRYLEVRYECLVMEPEATLREVCRFLDLPYEGRMLDYHRRADERLAEFTDWRSPEGEVLSRREERVALHGNTAQPPDPARIDAWRDALSGDDRAVFEAEAGDLLAELGYGP